MKIDLYEKIWMYGAGVMLTLFFASLANGAVRQGHHPPSHVETIDPAAVMKDERFRTQGVRVDEQGNVTQGDPVLIDSEGCIVYNDEGADARAVAVIGVTDLVVVVTKDAVLVVPKDQTEDVKKAVQALQARNAKQL